jgi:hypothetical protein
MKNDAVVCNEETIMTSSYPLGLSHTFYTFGKANYGEIFEGRRMLILNIHSV